MVRHLASFSRIVDTETLIPESREPFAGLAGAFDSGPSISGGNIAFGGLGSSDLRGIYTYADNTVAKIADTSTLVPGHGVTFSTDFGHPSIDGRSVAFVGAWGDEMPAPWGSKNTGVFVSSENGLLTIADNGTIAPSGKATFKGFYGAVHKDGYTAFVGFLESGESGICLSYGEDMIVVHDDRTPLPQKSGGFFAGGGSGGGGAGGSWDKSSPSTDTKEGKKSTSSSAVASSIAKDSDRVVQVVWCAKDNKGNIGIFSYDDGQITAVADNTTPIPVGRGTFTGFGVRESVDNGEVVFVGFGKDNQTGVYAWIDGELTVVVDTGTPIPGGEGTFQQFSPFNDVAISNGNIVFTAAGSNEQGGIYLYRTGDESLWPIIQHGDTLDGVRIKVNQRVPPIDDWWVQIPPLSLNFEGFDGSDLVFLVELPDGSGAIYKATIQ